MDKRRASVFASAGVAAALLVGGAALFANAAGEPPVEPASQIQVADTPSSTVAPTTTVEVTTTTVVPVEAPAPAPVQPKVATGDTGVVTTNEPAPAPRPIPTDANGEPLNPTNADEMKPPPPPPGRTPLPMETGEPPAPPES